MKLSSISLFGAALAAIVVGAIAAPVPCSLKQANLFERDVDGELVDGLFTRASGGQRCQASERRRQARKSHIDVAEADCATADAQYAAFQSYCRLFHLTEDPSHYNTATQHAHEGMLHYQRSDTHLSAATAAHYGTRTEEQKNLLKNKTRYMGSVNGCKEEATKSQKYAEDMITSHGKDHCPDPFKPQHPHLIDRHPHRNKKEASTTITTQP